MWSSKNSGKTVNIDGKSGSGKSGWGGLTSSYPTGGSHGEGGSHSTSGTSGGSYSVGSYNSTFLSSYSGYGNSQGLGKLYEPEEVLGMSGHTKKNPYGDSETIDQIVDYCRKKSGEAWGSNAIVCGGGKGYMKVINLSRTDMHDNDCGNLFYTLKDFNFNLEILNLSNNRIGDLGLESMIYGITSLQFQTLYSADNGWKPYQSSLKTVQNVITINLSNNQIGDKGAYILADHLAKGNLPSTKSIDFSGNQITATGEGYFAKAMQNSTVQDMYVTLKNAVGTKKDYYGPFLKQVLKDAQNNGVDIKNIVVDKSLIASIKDNTEMSWNIGISFLKCKFVPVLEAPSLAADAFVLAYPKHVLSKIFSPTETLACVFNGIKEEFDTDLGAKIAVRDLELMGVDEFIHTSE